MSGTPSFIYYTQTMQPWRHYLLAIIFYNSTDAARTTKLVALYILTNTDVSLTTSPRRVDDEAPASTIGPDAGRRVGVG